MLKHSRNFGESKEYSINRYIPLSDIPLSVLVCDIMYFEAADADDCLGQGRWALSVISRAAESR